MLGNELSLADHRSKLACRFASDVDMAMASRQNQLTSSLEEEEKEEKQEATTLVSPFSRFSLISPNFGRRIPSQRLRHFTDKPSHKSNSASLGPLFH